MVVGYIDNKEEVMKMKYGQKIISLFLCLVLLAGLFTGITSVAYADGAPDVKLNSFSVQDNTVYSYNTGYQATITNTQIINYSELDYTDRFYAGEIVITISNIMHDDGTPADWESVKAIKIAGNTWSWSFSTTPDYLSDPSWDITFLRSKSDDGSYRLSNNNVWIQFGTDNRYYYRVILIPEGAYNNNKPIIKPDAVDYSSPTVIAGNQWELTLHDVFQDPDDDHLTFFVKTGDGDQEEIGNVFVFTPTEAGDYSFTFFARDRDLESDEFIVSLNASSQTNRKPVLRSGIVTPDTKTIELNSSWYLDLETIFEDPDSDDLTYRVSVDGGEKILCESLYDYSATEVGSRTFSFYAYDREYESDAYIITIITADGGQWPAVQSVTLASNASLKSMDNEDVVAILSAELTKTYDELVDIGYDYYGIPVLLCGELELHVDKKLDASKTYFTEDEAMIVVSETVAGWSPIEALWGQFDAGELTAIIWTSLKDDGSTSVGLKVTIVEPEEVVNVAQSSLTLNGDIGVNFYLNIPENLVDSAYVCINFRGETKRYKVSEVTPSDGMYKFTAKTYATEMRAPIVLTVEDVSGNKIRLLNHDGTIDYTENGYTYSIERYFTLAREQYTAYPKVIALVNAMDEYGKYAQNFFNHTSLEVGDVSDVTLAVLEQYKMVRTDMPTGLEYGGTTLVLDSTTAYRHYFKAASGHRLDEFTFTIDGVTQTLKEKDGKYYIEVSDIRADKLNEFKTLVISNGTSETYSIKYCALSYARTAVNQNLEMANVTRALYKYFVAADACF